MRGRRAAAVGAVLALALGCSAPAAHPRRVLAVRDAATGKVLWSKELSPFHEGFELLVVDGVVLRHGTASLVAQDLRDGHELWTVVGDQMPRALLPESLVFQNGHDLKALTPAGRTAWARSTGGHVVDSRTAVLLVSAAPTRQCVRGRCTTTPPGAGPVDSTLLTMLDPRTGRARWHASLPGAAQEVTVGATANAVVTVQSDNATGKQTVVGLSTRDGRRVWSRPVQGVSGIADGEGAIVLESGAGRATRIDPLTGRELWSAAGFSPWLMQPYVGIDRSHRGARIYQLDPTTGARLPGEAPMTYSGAATGDLLVGADDSVLTAVRAGQQVWTSRLPEGVRPGTFVATDGAFVATLTESGFPEPHD